MSNEDTNVMQMGLWIMKSCEWLFNMEQYKKGKKAFNNTNIWVQ